MDGSLWVRGQLPGQVAVGCRSEFCFYMWSGHCLVSQHLLCCFSLLPASWSNPPRTPGRPRLPPTPTTQTVPKGTGAHCPLLVQCENFLDPLLPGWGGACPSQSSPRGCLAPLRGSSGFRGESSWVFLSPQHSHRAGCAPPLSRSQSSGPRTSNTVGIPESICNWADLWGPRASPEVRSPHPAGVDSALLSALYPGLLQPYHTHSVWLCLCIEGGPRAHFSWHRGAEAFLCQRW